MGKSTINGPFSIAMLNYQRVDSIDSAVSTIAQVPPLEQISWRKMYQAVDVWYSSTTSVISQSSVISHQSLTSSTSWSFLLSCINQSHVMQSVLFYSIWPLSISISVSASVPISSFYLLLSTYLSFYLSFVFIVTYLSAQDFFNCWRFPPLHPTNQYVQHMNKSQVGVSKRTKISCGSRAGLSGVVGVVRGRQLKLGNCCCHLWNVSLYIYIMYTYVSTCPPGISLTVDNHKHPTKSVR